jgi:Cu/Ag efflux pump CusA
VRDGNAPQTNIVHVDGNRSVLLQRVQERIDLDARHRQRHQEDAAVIKPSLPDALEIKPIGDQSLFVRAAIAA